MMKENLSTGKVMREASQSLGEIAGSIRLVVTDLDGTLLNSGKQVSRRTLDAVRALKQKGIFFTICSGRVYPMTEYYHRLLEIDGPIITCNGAVIMDTHTGSMTAGSTIPVQNAHKLLAYCKQYRLDASALSAGPSFFFPYSTRIRRFQQYNQIAYSRGLSGMDLQWFDERLDCVCTHEIHKILIYHPDSVVLERARGFIREQTGLGCTSSEPDILDVMAAGCDKGKGVRTLARMLQIPMEQVCVFGDYLNDVPMLRGAGLPVAMNNGCKEAKAAALLIAPPNDEDGVAQVLEEYLIKDQT